MNEQPIAAAPIVPTEALNTAVSAATSPEAIRAALSAESATQVAEADRLAAEQATAEAARVAAETTEAKPFTCVENIGGRDFEFEAATQAELDREVANAYRIAYNVRQPETQAVEVVDPAVAAAEAQRLADEDAAQKAILAEQFKLGTITIGEYIEKSGEMDKYLANKGISVDSLKKVVEDDADIAEQKSWAEATENFKNSPAGADWPGGDQNLKTIWMQLIALGLENDADKTAALAQAYESMKTDGLVWPVSATPAGTTASAAPAPAAPAAPAAAVPAPAAPAPPPAPRTPATSSSIFGASSGVSGVHTQAPAAAPAASSIPADASPAEILDAWNKANVAAGRNPNDAFVERFSNKR